ncbi:MAG: flagellar hook-associated protein FlgL [Paraglaciecola sp.]|uniref:flagellar hook-associated protein FlgL n=1 Tax=Pseudomonadati TaxID=3379134 RepID=UPI00273DE640|nr:flagellar hook-associated protein FlgL [Paraglaciecola sp.]MDP5032920.1 flagellar hook-associated protein FlgL [Paraglaciecola sp.]MDP5134251.1 flagellar hook-associated protein FlgL [Paraglaciecola sp.]
MRISTGQLYDRSINAVLENQGNLSDVQTQLSSGKKILRPSDDPVGAAQVIRLTEEIDLIAQYKKNSNVLTSSLEQEETILSSINTAVNRARELMVQSGNGVLNSGDKKAIAIEIEEIRDEVFGLMNTQNAMGEYIFAGYQSNSPAFDFNQSASGNKYSFAGDAGVNEIKLSNSVKIPVNNSGKEVFEDVLARLKSSITSTSGVTSASSSIEQQNTYDKFHEANYDAVTAANNQYQIAITAANQVQVSHVASGAVLDTISFASGSPFTFKGISFNLEGTVGNTVNFQLDPPEKMNIAETLNNFVVAMRDENLDPTQFEQALNDALVGSDNALSSIADATSAIGGRLNVKQSVYEANLDLEITIKAARSNIEDVDYAEAVSELSKQETALQAAQATFGRVTGNSLFDYI